MASSSDAVRNFVYDYHRHNLRQGWQIVQQLEQKQLDSWERIYEAYAVKSPNDEASWDAADDRKVADFGRACPLLGQDLAAQLAAQAALFMRNKQPQALKRGNSGRLGSLRDRIDRLYLRERASPASRPMSSGRSFFQSGKLPKTAKLVPFMEAVQHPGFSTVVE